MRKRDLQQVIEHDLESKLVLLSGARQVGKTTLAKNLASECTYLNYDVLRDRKVIFAQSWEKDSPLLVLDELHKLKNWKAWLKGVWDGRESNQKILVTGSARLDLFRKAGESLAGRFFHHRLHPFSLRELESFGSTQTTFERLLERGGFPEPFLAASLQDAERWRLAHIDRIIRDDVSSIERVLDLSRLELLVQLLAERVGGAISYQNLSEDLGVSPPTVKRWIQLLEILYVTFSVRPFSGSSARSIRKEAKAYFLDTGRVESSPGARLENLVACHLLKWCNFRKDSRGERCELYYVRDKEGREVDFAVVNKTKVEMLIEVKESDVTPHRALAYYGERLKSPCYQLVAKLDRPLDVGVIKIRAAAEWLRELEV